MEDYIERIAANGRRIRFKPGTSKEKQDAFLSKYGRDDGEKAVSQDKSLEELMKMSNIPNGSGMNASNQASQFPVPNQTPQQNPMQQRPQMPQGNQPSSPMQPRMPQMEKSVAEGGDRPLVFDPRMGPSHSGNALGTELAASFIAGPLGRARSVLTRTLGHMGTQGGISALFNPQNALREGGRSAAITGVTHPIVELLGSNNKYARLLKRAILPILGGAGGSYLSEEAGLPKTASLLAGLLGAKVGQKLTSKLMSKQGLMHPAAEKITEHVEPKDIQKFEKAKQYGVHLTPAEASNHPSLISQSNKMGYTEKGAELLQKHKNSKIKQEEEALKKLKDKIYKPEVEDTLRQKGYEKLKKQEINPKSAQKIYKIPKEKYRYEEPVIKEAEFKKVAPKVKLIEPKRYEPEKVSVRSKEGFNLVRVPKNPKEIIKPEVKIQKTQGIQTPEKLNFKDKLIVPKEKKLILPPEKEQTKLIYGKPKGPIEFKQEGGHWVKPRVKLTEPGRMAKTSEAQVIKEAGWRPPNQKEINQGIIRAFQKNGVPSAKSETVRKAVDEVLGDPVWRESVKGVNKKTLYKNAAFLDLVKRKIHDLGTSSKSVSEGGKSELIQKVEKSFIRELDRSIPGYKNTRGLHERFKARETLEDLTSKGEEPGKSFFNTFKDKNKMDELIKHVRQVPGAKKDIKALQDIFESKRDIDIEKLANSLPQSITDKSTSRIEKLAESLMKAFKDGDYDQAAINLVTDKDWPKMIKELEKQTSREAKMAKFFEYISKILTKSKPLNILISKNPNAPLYASEGSE